MSFGFRQGCAPSPTLFNRIIDWIFDQALQGYPGTQVASNVQVSGLDYADDIVLLSNNNREMQGLDKSVNHHAAAVGMGIYYS